MNEEEKAALKSDIHEIISTLEKLIVHTCVCRSLVERMELRLGYLENRMKTALDQRKLNIACLVAALFALFATFLVAIFKIIMMFI